MRILKIISGALSIAIGLFVAFQSFFAGLFNMVTSNGEASGTVGLIVAILLLAGGIVSIVSSRGSMGADCALVALFGIGALVGFTMAGSYTDLIIWALWCLLCAVLALVDFILLYFEDDDGGYETAGPEEPASGIPTLRSLIVENNQKKRDAAIDALPEREAKGYLKQVVTAFINREAITPPDFDDDSRPGRVVLAVVVGVVGLALVGAVLFSLFGGDKGTNEPAQSGQPSASVSQTPAPSPSVTPSAEPEPEKDSYETGDSITSDGVTVTLVSVTETEGNEYFSPDEGKTFLVCEFEIENGSSGDIVVSSVLSFTAYVDEYATGMDIPAMTSSGKPQLDGTVAAGRRMNGIIGYEVDEDWSEIELRFTPSFWSREQVVFRHSRQSDG